MAESDYPYSKPKFSDDDERALSTVEMVERLRWAIGIAGSMGLMSVLFFWAGSMQGLPELSLLGLLCALFSVHAALGGIDVFAELRGRTLVDENEGE